MRHPHPNRKQAAFSLMELLVVLAIMVVLVGLALPAYMRVRQSSFKTMGLSNFRQMSAGIDLYAADNDNQFPPIYDPYSPPFNTESWRALLLPYIYNLEAKGEALVRLRARQKTIFEVPEAPPTTGDHLNTYTVGMNAYVSSFPALTRRAAVSRPQTIILLAEMGGYFGDACGPSDLYGEGTPAAVSYRREGGRQALVLYCDGHVESAQKEALLIHGKTVETNPWVWWWSL